MKRYLVLALVLVLLALPRPLPAQQTETACSGGATPIPIGGLFYAESTAAYFRDAVIRLNRVMPRRYCLKPETLVMGGVGVMEQLRAMCDRLIPKGNFALVVGATDRRRTTDVTVPPAPTLMSTYYRTPMLSLVSRAPESITEIELHKNVVHLLPHKAHEVEVWCALMTYYQFTHAVVLLSNDVVGNEYETRLRSRWWKSRTIRYLKFIHVEHHATDKNYFASLMASIASDQCRLVIVYAHGHCAAAIFREARAANMTGSDWTWIVSEFALDAPTLFDGVVAAQLIVPDENNLIDNAVNLLAYSIAHLLNVSSSQLFQRTMPTKECKAAEDNNWDGGAKIVKQLQRSLYVNLSDREVVLFDSSGFRKSSSYVILNKQPGKRELKVVGYYNESRLYFNEQVETLLADRLQSYDLHSKKDDERGIYMTLSEYVESGAGQYMMHQNDEFVDRSEHSAAETLLEREEKIRKAFLSSGKVGNHLTMDDASIYWPGGGEVERREFSSRWHVRVLTTESVPYVYVFKNPKKRLMEFRDQYGNVDTSKQSHHHPQVIDKQYAANLTDQSVIRCPGLRCLFTPPNSNETLEYCCFGHCIDLLVNLSLSANFTFDLLYSESGFGHYIEPNSEEDQESEGPRRKAQAANGSRTEGRWTGMVNELLSNRADMIAAPLTVNPTRGKVIDFTKPFKYPTLSILMKKRVPRSNLGSFLQPFETSLWVLMFFTVNVVAIGMFVFERFSPFGWYDYSADRSPKTACYPSKQASRNSTVANGDKNSSQNAETKRSADLYNPLDNWFCRFSRPKRPEEECGDRAVTLPQAVWLSWGIVLSTGPGEYLPRSFSARVFTMIWAALAMVIVSAYTANLAAYLVLDRPKEEIRGIDDPRLRNPSNSFKFSTVRNSDVEMYFKRYVELSAMYRAMESRSFDTVDNAIEAVRNNSINAFIWESSRLHYEALNDCQLAVTPDPFGKAQYAIGLRKELKYYVYYDWNSDVEQPGSGSKMQKTNNEETATIKGKSFLENLSITILQLLDNGFLESLDAKWTFTKLEDENVSPHIIANLRNHATDAGDNAVPPKSEENCIVDEVDVRLSLQNLTGIFILLFCGILISAVLLVFEVAFYRRVRRSQDAIRKARS